LKERICIDKKMAKSHRKKTKKSNALENRFKQASFALAGVLLGQLVESLMNSLAERAIDPVDGTDAAKESPAPTKSGLGEVAEPIGIGVAAVKAVAGDMAPHPSELFGSFKHKIQKAIERVGEMPKDFERAALVGVLDRATEMIDVSTAKKKKSKKKKKKHK
jgi:hypothetical protein